MQCTDELHELFYNFVLARTGTLTRMSIPPMKNVEALYPLKDYIARFEVHPNPHYLIILRLLICFARSRNVVSSHSSFNVNCDRKPEGAKHYHPMAQDSPSCACPKLIRVTHSWADYSNCFEL